MLSPDEAIGSMLSRTERGRSVLDAARAAVPENTGSQRQEALVDVLLGDHARQRARIEELERELSEVRDSAIGIGRVLRTVMLRTYQPRAPHVLTAADLEEGERARLSMQGDPETGELALVIIPQEPEGQ